MIFAFVEEREPLLNQSDDILTRYQLDIADLYPTRDFGIQMTEASEVTIEPVKSPDTNIAVDINKLNLKNNTVIAIEPEKESEYSDSHLESQLATSSSTLSEGFCLSLLGTSCVRAKQKNYRNGEENPDNIGSIFGKKSGEIEEQNPSASEKRPNKSKLSANTGTETEKPSKINSQDTRRTSFDHPTKEGTNNNSQVRDNTVKATSFGQEKLSSDKNGQGLLESVNENLKEISQQTANPSILKQSGQSNNMQQSCSEYSPCQLSKKAHTSKKMTCKGRGNPCVEAERDCYYRVPAERQKIILTSDKILQTSENNLLQTPCSCTTDSTEYNSTTPQQDSTETPYDSTFGTTPQETSSNVCFCYKCRSPLPTKREDYCSKNIPRYRSKRSVRSSRSTSPPPSCRKGQRERVHSPCDFRCGETRRPVRSKPRRSCVMRQRPQREDCACDGECRYTIIVIYVGMFAKFPDSIKYGFIYFIFSLLFFVTRC